MEASFSPYRKLWTGIILITVSVFAVMFVSLWIYGKSTQAPVPFVLTDQNGKTYHSQEENSYKLVYFGFTNCLDICPAGLLNISNVLKILGKNADKIQPVFITVDPARDSPAAIKEYIKNFDPRFIGLTGSEEDLSSVRKAYTVYAKKVNSPEYNDYTMDHSAYIYLTDRNDIILKVFDYRVPADEMADQIRLYFE